MKEFMLRSRAFDEGKDLCKELGALSGEGWYVVAMTESMSKVEGMIGQGSWTVLLCREKDGSYR